MKGLVTNDPSVGDRARDSVNQNQQESDGTQKRNKTAQNALQNEPSNSLNQWRNRKWKSLHRLRSDRRRQLPDCGAVMGDATYRAFVKVSVEFRKMIGSKEALNIHTRRTGGNQHHIAIMKLARRQITQLR
ncbi:MAG: hypothetical protein ACLSEG_12255 [Enterococcus sp.]